MGDEPTVLLSVLLYEKDLLPEMQDVSLRMFLEYLRVKEKEEAPHGAREGGMIHILLAVIVYVVVIRDRKAWTKSWRVFKDVFNRA